MKIFRLLLIMACVAIPLSGFARKKIKVQDKWDTDKKSIAPVEAWLEDSGKDISLQFYRNLGSVNVTVTSQSGQIVYEETINATVMSSFSIILEDTLKGEYVLSITSADNQLCGEFLSD